MNLMHRLLASLLLLAPLAACASDRQVIAQADDVHHELEPAVIEDAELSGYLQRVGERVVVEAKKLSVEGFGPESHRKEDDAWMFSEVKFHFVNSETLNAFTTGGRHMYIYTQLLLQCRTEDELTAVVAHEYAHVYARHVHKGMNRQYLAMGGAVAGGALGYALGGDNKEEYAALGAVTVGTAATFLNMGFTREDEAEADDLGFVFYTRAGWDPDRFADFFQAMIDAGYDTQDESTSDHPSLASRVQATRQRAAQLPPEAKNWRKPPVVDAAQFRAMQQRATQLAKTMPKDQSLEKAQTLLNAVGNCLVPKETPEQIRARQQLQAIAAQ